MREIIMKTISAGPDGVYQPGSWRTLPRAEAAALVRGGFAFYATVDPEEVAVVIPDEIAVVEPEEVAAKKKGRPRK